MFQPSSSSTEPSKAKRATAPDEGSIEERMRKRAARDEPPEDPASTANEGSQTHAAPALGWPVHAGVALWELERPVWPVQETQVEVPLRDVTSELTCAVCLGVVRHCQTVMECVHRFCAACISKALRLGKKECPACRIKVTSKRNLRPDYNVDSLVRRLFPDLDQFEHTQQEAMASIAKAAMNAGLSVHKQATPLRPAPSDASPPVRRLPPTVTRRSSKSFRTSQLPLLLLLERDRHSPPLYARLPPGARLAHLAVRLATHLQLPSAAHVLWFVPGQSVPLSLLFDPLGTPELHFQLLSPVAETLA